MKLLKQKKIESPLDIMELDIIDWNRLNGSWNNAGEALQSISSWFVGSAHYTIIEHDLSHAPERDDWPGWDHVGNHEPLGRLYWNDFHYHRAGKITFSDAPDFYGQFIGKDGKPGAHFYGDIGKISAQAFAITQKKMRAHDLWISVIDTHHQVLIESLLDIQTVAVYEILGDEDSLKIAEMEAKTCPYCNQPQEIGHIQQLKLF